MECLVSCILSCPLGSTSYSHELVSHSSQLCWGPWLTPRRSANSNSRPDWVLLIGEESSPLFTGFTGEWERGRSPSPSPQPPQTMQMETICFTGILGQLPRELKFSRGEVKVCGGFDCPRITRESSTGLDLHWVGWRVLLRSGPASSSLKHLDYKTFGKATSLHWKPSLSPSRQFLNHSGELSRTPSHA